MFQKEGTCTVVVFSHPNHELAIFGLLQSLRPHLVYLTDGGGEARVEQTRQGLKSIDLLQRAHFLNYTEKSFYEAFLECDFSFYAEIKQRVKDFFREIQPRQILCDAIEFYNPVHDVSLPVVQGALQGQIDGVTLFEVPLIYQSMNNEGSYHVQAMPPSRRAEEIVFALSEPELTAKMTAWQSIYTILADQIGPIISKVLPESCFPREVIAPASTSFSQPGIEHVLRYEWRADVLLESKQIKRKITFAHHYIPVVKSLLNNPEM